jgi:hypothetical protein
MFAASTKHCLLRSLVPRPCFWLVGFRSIVAADASVKFAAAGVLDSDDVKRRAVVLALGEWGYGEAVYYGRFDRVGM